MNYHFFNKCLIVCNYFIFTIQSIIGATDMRGCKDGRAVMNKPKNKEKTKAEIIRAFG